MRIAYAYLKQQTWLYRRNYPKALQPMLGQALKQSLKTGDAKVAKVRAAEINAKFEEIVAKAKQGIVEQKTIAPTPAPVFEKINPIVGKTKVHELARIYLNERSSQLRHGGFKSVRFSIGLLVSAYGKEPASALTRDHGRRFATRIGQLSKHVGKSERNRGLGLEGLVARSDGDKITPQTQKRILSQVSHFLDWCFYRGDLMDNPFKTLRIDQRVKVASYVAPTDDEVRQLVGLDDPVIGDLLVFCLLTGMRAGEAAGLLREDLCQKGNLGWFVDVRANSVRELKTDAAERQIPLHDGLVPLLERASGERLFPDLTVAKVTKRFAQVRAELQLERPGLVFHSTRKWFITQCERTGVPEHFTASLVGHQSARSENRLTYGIYSAGISDAQKREIVDGVRLPT